MVANRVRDDGGQGVLCTVTKRHNVATALLFDAIIAI